MTDNPQITHALETWKQQPESETWLGNLQKNTDLKGLLLDETPWLSEAADETARKRNLALLLDVNAMDDRLQTAVRKLENLQGQDGAGAGTQAWKVTAIRLRKWQSNWRV